MKKVCVLVAYGFLVAFSASFKQPDYNWCATPRCISYLLGCFLACAIWLCLIVIFLLVRYDLSTFQIFTADLELGPFVISYLETQVIGICLEVTLLFSFYTTSDSNAKSRAEIPSDFGDLDISWVALMSLFVFCIFWDLYMRHLWYVL